jgi:phenylacetate-CoA ligase
MGIEDSTGGSTGEPTQFFHDEGMLRAKAALILYARLRMGWKPHLATIIVWGSERDIGKQISFRNRMNNTLFRNYLVDGYHLSRQTVERVLLLIRRHKPVSVYGFSSMLEFVAHEALSMNACTPAGTVYLAWNGGEMLFPDQNKAFQKAFGVPILNVYGGRELSVMACQYKADDLLHVQRPWNFIELVDDAGKPVGPGEPGRVICTSTVCRGTPFLRYEIGDSADYDAADCDDTGIRALRQILGRVGSVVVLPDGRRIQNLYWNHLMKGFKEVRQFQIRVKNDGRLIIMLKGKAFSDEREAEFRHIVSGFLGDLYLEFKWVDAIPLTPQGKLVQVIRDTT